MDFNSSETKKNLLRAFAGESQARNRYTFAAAQARKQNLYVIEAVFNFTAGQEKEHAELFYNQLSCASGESISIDGSYPIDISDSVITLLRSAQHNENEEFSDVYKNFSMVAEQEGFTEISTLFKNIAAIENTHSQRFDKFAQLMEQGKLFVSDVKTKWMCLNCGFVYEGTNVPPACPVCRHDRGYFIRLELIENPV
jgi:rubrerythrin